MNLSRLVAVIGLVVMFAGAIGYGHFGKNVWFLAAVAVGVAVLLSSQFINARNL